MARILNTEQAAEKLQVRPLTVRKYLRKGLIPGRRLGREWRIVETDLEMFISGRPPVSQVERVSALGICEDIPDLGSEEHVQPGDSGQAEWERMSREARKARIEAVMGRYEHVPGALDRFLAEKHAETEAEEQRSDRRRRA
jgi:excisionase family DNA binding protein